MNSIETQLRQAIERDGRSLYALAKESGIPLTTLSRFAKQERSIQLDTAAKLCRTLGLTLRKG